MCEWRGNKQRMSQWIVTFTFRLQLIHKLKLFSTISKKCFKQRSMYYVLAFVWFPLDNLQFGSSAFQLSMLEILFALGLFVCPVGSCNYRMVRGQQETHRYRIKPWCVRCAIKGFFYYALEVFNARIHAMSKVRRHHSLSTYFFKNLIMHLFFANVYIILCCVCAFLDKLCLIFFSHQSLCIWIYV